MSDRITIKVSPEVHRRLKVLAAQAGETLNELLDRLSLAEQARKAVGSSVGLTDQKNDEEVKRSRNSKPKNE